ncbi:MAG: GAF domain-containing sensor histidine kinase [Chloroflexota bacterium]
MSQGEPSATERGALQTAIHRGARLRALHEAALMIAAPVPAEPAAVAGLLATLVERAMAALEACGGTIVLVEDPAWSGLVPNAGPADGLITVYHTGELRRWPWPASGSTMHVLTSGEAVSVPDVLVPTRFGWFAKLAEDGVRAFADVPLRSGGQVLGRVGLTFPRPGQLPAEDWEALELFAAHAAAALDRVRLMHAEHRRADQAQELARREAEALALRRLDQLKNQLLAMISHELRTPLTVIHGYAHRLSARFADLDPVVARTADRILFSSTQLTRLVEDLTDFSRMEHGEVEVRAQPFDLSHLLRELAADLGHQAGGGRLVSELPGQLLAQADPARVVQIVTNLVGNAFTYAPSGPVVLRAKPCGGGRVRVEVEDRGPGIPLEDQPRVWDKLFRGPGVAGLNVARGGGIGLALVKALAEVQGGRVGLDSTPGWGSCFWCELPAHGPADPSQGSGDATLRA